MVERINSDNPISVSNTNFDNKVEVNNDSNAVDFSSNLKKTYTLDEIFDMASVQYNVPKELLVAVTKAESDFTPDVVSYCGATGLMQIMPKTADFLGVEDSYDPLQNIMGGAKLYSYMLDKYDGDLDLAISAYAAGVGNVKKYGGVPPFCEKYIEKIHRYLNNGVKVPDKTVTVDATSNAEVLNGSGYYNGTINYDNHSLTTPNANYSPTVSTANTMANTATNISGTGTSSANKASSSLAVNDISPWINVAQDVRFSDLLAAYGMNADNSDEHPYLEAFHNYTAFMKVLDILDESFEHKNEHTKNNT